VLWHAGGGGTPVWVSGTVYSLLKGGVVSLAVGLCTAGRALGAEEKAASWCQEFSHEGLTAVLPTRKTWPEQAGCSQHPESQLFAGVRYFAHAFW